MLVVASMTFAGHLDAQSNDWRVRVADAARLGKVGGPGARQQLESGLTDSHYAVRSTCAAALKSLGDKAAVRALETAEASETNAAAKSIMHDAIDSLRVGNAKYVLSVGTMKSSSHGGNFDGVMRSAAKSKAASLNGSLVLDGSDPAVFKSATNKKIPVLILDGTLTQLTQSGQGGGVTVSAKVNVAISTPKAGLKAMVAGNGSASGGAVPELQERAVGAAVDGAVGSVTRDISKLAQP
jgi:hypothetical protein